MKFEPLRSVDKHKTEEEARQEAQAKGHRETPEKNQLDQSEAEMEAESVERKKRGHQRGFGKNQGKEGQERSAPHGTRAEGAEHG